MIRFSQYLEEKLVKPPEVDEFKQLFKDVETTEQWKKSHLSDVMKKYGWKHVGNGASAKVYAHDAKDYIIKVYGPDRGYDTWLKFMEQHQSNPYVPKIRGKVVKLAKNVSVVRLEKLKEASMNDAYPFFGKIASDEAPDDKNLRVLWDFLRDYKYDVDSAPANVMMRGSQIVLIDPLA
jgi:hypothetical protein